MGEIEKVNMLTQEQRENALHNARLRIAGAEPQLVNFMQNTQSHLPPRVAATINILSAGMLGASFVPSAIRLHQVGVQSYSASMQHVDSVYVAALCTVLMAETGQVIFSLAVANTRVRWQRIMLLVGALICTCIALSGNAVAVGIHATENAFTLLETYAPPLLVLITAQVLKTQILHGIEARYQAQRGYADAQGRWMDAIQNAHESPRWMHYCANALRDGLRRANARSTAVIRALTDEEWRSLILRELDAENWYARAESHAVQVAHVEHLVAARAHAGGGQRTYETDGQVEQMDDKHVATCPYCSRAFENADANGAKKALAAHMRFCVVRKEQREVQS